MHAKRAVSFLPAEPEQLFNRELSWLEFNRRVLQLAQRDDTPLMERLKFLSIFSSNLDEFYMIRVANLRELELAKRTDLSRDGRTPVQQLTQINQVTQQLVAEQYATLRDEIGPALQERGVAVVTWEDLTDGQKEHLRGYFNDQVFPVLTPLTVDPSHPFPYLANLSINIVVALQTDETSDDRLNYAIIDVPSVLEHLIPIDDDPDCHRFIALEHLVAANANQLFGGLHVRDTWVFRLTRNADLTFEEQETENLLVDIERELRSRKSRPAVRLEHDVSMPDEVRDWLIRVQGLSPRGAFCIQGPLDLTRLMRIYALPIFPELRDPTFNPRINARMASPNSVFSIIRDGDVLLHHPYESFSTVAELVQHASEDPRVLAIKQTLYRTSGDSVIIKALKQAAQNGKQVTAIVELKARFDERNNIDWARELERAGAHVVYGMVGLKTHWKATLVVRQESTGIRRYAHLGTGNYNSKTALLYTDLGLLTCDPKLTVDVSQLFNVLTGYNRDLLDAIRNGTIRRPKFSKLLVAPFELRERLLALVQNEIDCHNADGSGYIAAKLNSLSDPLLIAAFYAASQAGVRVDLNVRGICCLRPGIEGLSENIRVVSVVDRFLEHSRLLYFHSGGQNLVYCGSADLMNRNLERRIEGLFPIEAPELKKRVLDTILRLGLEDTSHGSLLQPDGSYVRQLPTDGAEPLRSQMMQIELVRHAGLKSLPYAESLKTPRKRDKKKGKSEARASRATTADADARTKIERAGLVSPRARRERPVCCRRAPIRRSRCCCRRPALAGCPRQSDRGSPRTDRRAGRRTTGARCCG